MKEYRIANGWAIFLYILIPALIGLCIWVLLMPLIPAFSHTIPLNAWYFLFPLMILVISMLVMGMVELIKGKIVIDEHSIVQDSGYKRKELPLDGIKGFRVNDKYLNIEPIDTGMKSIRISNNIGGFQEIVDWFSERYPDLDKLNAEQEEEAILGDDAYGTSAGERSDRLLSARRTARIMNVTGLVTGLYLLFYPHPYFAAAVANAVVVLACLFVFRAYNGLIRFSDYKGSAYPSMVFCLCTTAGSILLRALIDYELFAYTRAWELTAIIVMVLLIIAFAGNKGIDFRKQKDLVNVFYVLALSTAVGFGSVVIANCQLDQSAPEQYLTKVLDKRISSGKHSSYYLKLAPWPRQASADEVSVGKRFYNDIRINDDVQVNYEQGRLHIPWFYLTKP